MQKGAGVLSARKAAALRVQGPERGVADVTSQLSKTTIWFLLEQHREAAAQCLHGPQHSLFGKTQYTQAWNKAEILCSVDRNFCMDNCRAYLSYYSSKLITALFSAITKHIVRCALEIHQPLSLQDLAKNKCILPIVGLIGGVLELEDAIRHERYPKASSAAGVHRIIHVRPQRRANLFAVLVFWFILTKDSG